MKQPNVFTADDEWLLSRLNKPFRDSIIEIVFCDYQSERILSFQVQLKKNDFVRQNTPLNMEDSYRPTILKVFADEGIKSVDFNNSNTFWVDKKENK